METLIGPETELEGTIHCRGGSVRIDGRLRGKLLAAASAMIGESGVLEADVEAANVVVAGTITGDVIAKERLELLPTGRLLGNARACALVVHEGAVFDGTCSMTEAKTGEIPVAGKKDQVFVPSENGQPEAAARPSQANPPGRAGRPEPSSQPSQGSQAGREAKG